MRNGLDLLINSLSWSPISRWDTREADGIEKEKASTETFDKNCKLNWKTQTTLQNLNWQLSKVVAWNCVEGRTKGGGPDTEQTE